MFKEEYCTERLIFIFPNINIVEQITEFENRNRQFYSNFGSIRDDEYYRISKEDHIHMVLLNENYECRL